MNPLSSSFPQFMCKAGPGGFVKSSIDGAKNPHLLKFDCRRCSRFAPTDMAKNKATLNIDPELHRELKIAAARRGMKISELVERLLKEDLRKKIRSQI